MSDAKPNRRKSAARKLEPIDWHEFANDAVLNGNMSTLFHRPPTEDPTTYASSEALLEIEKRSSRPTAGLEPSVESFEATDLTATIVSSQPTMGPTPAVNPPPITRQPISAPVSLPPAVDTPPVLGPRPTVDLVSASAFPQPTLTSKPPVYSGPTVGSKRKIKPIRDVQDALTLAGQVLYKTMYGAPDGARSKSCSKGYRQLAAESHLDKDTVRDLIADFKEKGMVREIGTYNPDTRSSKTYEVLSYKAILQLWRDAGIHFVTTGRQRPEFCTADGDPVRFIPTVGQQSPQLTPTAIPQPTVGTMPPLGLVRTVGSAPSASLVELLQALHQITGAPVDREAGERLIRDCRAEAPDCTVEEILELAWSKAFLCRSGKIENPMGFLITQLPKHFQPEALHAFRDRKRQELESAALIAAREEQRRREYEEELAAMEERQRIRTQVAENHRLEQGIDLWTLLSDPAADEVLKEWARRMLKLGHRYHPGYE